MVELKPYENYILQLSCSPLLIIGFYGWFEWDSFSKTKKDLNDDGVIERVGMFNKDRSKVFWYDYDGLVLPNID